MGTDYQVLHCPFPTFQHWFLKYQATIWLNDCCQSFPPSLCRACDAPLLWVFFKWLGYTLCWNNLSRKTKTKIHQNNNNNNQPTISSCLILLKGVPLYTSMPMYPPPTLPFTKYGPDIESCHHNSSFLLLALLVCLSFFLEVAASTMLLSRSSSASISSTSSSSGSRSWKVFLRCSRFSFSFEAGRARSSSVQASANTFWRFKGKVLTL